MSSPTETRERVRSGARLRERFGDTGWTRVRAVASLGMVFGLGAVGTLAAWSDTATASTGTFSTSAINVQMDLAGDRPVHDFTSLEKTNLPRGGSVASMLPVNNIGTEDFNYVAKVSASNAGTATYGGADASTYAQNLTLAVFRGGSSSGTACSGGTPVDSKTLQLDTEIDVVPSHRVNVGDSDNLCFQVTLNANAPIAARMSSVSLDFDFVATKA
ncbi:SipW-dependent-type signal peptide-containing protein [Gordonia sp. (in: high G+C Gram-positive bacteria)]|uniref:SipW-dependent-type signal peptide-containing protein n=1 Tax=Gordonia sp. (in: high G+C Gram-positive bacteria) TaxID=84139 RepID=UPI003C73B0D5